MRTFTTRDRVPERKQREWTFQGCLFARDRDLVVVIVAFFLWLSLLLGLGKCVLTRVAFVVGGDFAVVGIGGVGIGRARRWREPCVGVWNGRGVVPWV